MSSHPRFISIPRAFARRWLAQSVLASAMIGASAIAQPPAAPAAVPPVSVARYTLADCLALARQNQPSLGAAVSSLAAAESAQRGLNQLRFAGLIARDVPVRRQQAALGVNAASANLCQVERDIAASVARTYYAVIFAREQRKVADEVVANVKTTVELGNNLLRAGQGPPDLTKESIDRAKIFQALAETKLDEANRGLQRARAALREAMGLAPEVVFDVATNELPAIVPGVNKDAIIAMARSMRGEVSQAESARCITVLEIEAQAKSRFPKFPTSAAGGDIHAKPIPTGTFGSDYKPGAIGPELPTLFVGPRSTRMQRASELSERAAEVVEKARNLVALEAEDAFLLWEESVAKAEKLGKAAKDAETLAKDFRQKLIDNMGQSYKDVVEAQVLGSQIKAQRNEALYYHAVALTELERVTAGGFAAGVTVTPAK